MKSRASDISADTWYAYSLADMIYKQAIHIIANLSISWIKDNIKVRPNGETTKIAYNQVSE